MANPIQCNNLILLVHHRVLTVPRIIFGAARPFLVPVQRIFMGPKPKPPQPNNLYTLCVYECALTPPSPLSLRRFGFVGSGSRWRRRRCCCHRRSRSFYCPHHSPSHTQGRILQLNLLLLSQPSGWLEGWKCARKKMLLCYRERESRVCCSILRRMPRPWEVLIEMTGRLLRTLKRGPLLHYTTQLMCTSVWSSNSLPEKILSSRSQRWIEIRERRNESCSNLNDPIHLRFCSYL